MNRISFEEYERQVSRHGLTAREHQLGLVRMGTIGLREDQVEEIADRCIAARKSGATNVSVWHHAAAHFGSQCRCYECEPEGVSPSPTAA